MDITLQEIKVFISLWKYKNITNVAKSLGLSQPAISKCLNQLELKLGVTLYLRHKDGLQATPNGIKFYSEIFPLYEELNITIHQFEKTNKLKSQRELRVGILPELGEVLVPNFLHLNMIQGKPWKIYFHLDSHDNLAKLCKKSELHFFITFKKIVNETFRCHHLFPQKIYFLSSIVHSNKNESWGDFQFVGYREQDPLIELFRKKFFDNNSSGKNKMDFVANSHHLMIQYLINNPQYLGIFPEYSLPVLNAIKNNQLRVSPQYTMDTFLFGIYHHTLDIEMKNFCLEIKKNFNT